MKSELKVPYLAEDFPIIIKTCQSRSIDKAEDVYKTLHEAIEIKYFIEGESTLLIGTESYTVRAGDTVVVNPYEFHATIGYGANPGKYHIFMVEPEFFENADSELPSLRNLLHGHRLSFKNHLPNNEEIAKILIAAAKESEEKCEFFRLRIKGLMYELLVQLLRHGVNESLRNDRTCAPRHWEIIEPALRKIRDKYFEHLTVECLADECRVSKYYFCRTFKAAVGISPSAYLTEYRLKVADVILKSSADTLAQIASKCGFEDANYFSRCYKKHFGISPNKRRKTVFSS